MSEFGLTGGIGSGKSSVAQRLVARGAGLVDADATVRDLQRAGEPVFVAMVDHFGDSIVGPDGELDRPAVADIVFNDADQLEALNKIVHPAVRDSMQSQRDALANTHQVVILDIPLLVDGVLKARDKAGQDAANPYGDLAGIVVVDLAPEVAIARLVAHRGFSEADASARVHSQVSRDDRLALADFVIDNSGDLVALDTEIDRCWTWIQSVLQRT